MPVRCGEKGVFELSSCTASRGYERYALNVLFFAIFESFISFHFDFCHPFFGCGFSIVVQERELYGEEAADVREIAKFAGIEKRK